MASVDHRHLRDRWQDCSLCASHQLSLQVLRKAKQRQVQWPQPIPQAPVNDDSSEFTSLDDAFANLLHYMSSSSRQCKRYYGSSNFHCRDEADKRHCGRFHTNHHYTKVQRKHPLESQEAVHLQVVPGTYAVTAGSLEGGQQTHMVNVQQGQTVELDFCV